MKLHYLTPEEEQGIKANIPWESVDRKARDLVQFANSVPGVATIQSCAGHIRLKDNGSFYVSNACIAFRTTREIAERVIFELAPSVGITDVELRYFDDSTFWVSVLADPSEHGKLYALFRQLKGKESGAEGG